jgi:hypothetical protein
MSATSFHPPQRGGSAAIETTKKVASVFIEELKESQRSGSRVLAELAHR